MKIVCLAENTAIDERFGAEHGLSLYIETDTRRLLFDMGQSALFAENAAKTGVDLQRVDTAIISHGHYDHGGGLPHFLSLNAKAPVYISRYAFEPHFNADDRYIGLDTAFVSHKQLRVTDSVHTLGDGLTLYANATEIGTLAHGSAGLTAEQNGQRIPDDFRHEQYLLIEEHGKRILISGCSHRGILEITAHFKPDVLIGGFHIFKLPTDYVTEHYGAVLNKYNTAFYTCHCTGVPPYEALVSMMPRLHYLASGQTLIL